MKPSDYGEKDIRNRTFKFAVEIVSLVGRLPRNIAAHELGKQVLRSGTGIGANVREAQRASTKKLFTYKMQIALEEADETIYWLELLWQAKIASSNQVDHIITEAKELYKILMTIVKKSKSE